MSRDDLYLQPRQAATRAATDWENDLADVIEAAFAAGARDLDELVAGLNRSRVRPPGHAAWTPEVYVDLMKRLGA